MSTALRPDAERVLIAEDDGIVAQLAAGYLRREGFSTTIAPDGPSALSDALDHPPVLVVLDLALPGMSGVEVLRRLRAVADTPVIVTSGRGDVETRVKLLALGADDYLVKPYFIRELVGRVHAILRRFERPAAVLVHDALSAGGLEVAVRAREARRGGVVIDLTSLEHALLLHLMRHPGVTFSRQQLLREVWDLGTGDAGAVTVLVKRLREKIEIDPHHPFWVQTVWGGGYRFHASREPLG